MRGAAWAVLLAAGLSGRLARAEVPVRLAYQAGPGCPDREAFVARVRARHAQLRVVDDPAAPAYEVRVEQTERGARGHLVLVGQDDARRREVSTGRCDEAADALALVLALSLEPPAPPPAASAAPAAPATAAPPASVAPPPVASMAPLAPPAGRRPASEVSWGVGALGGVRTAIAPGAMGAAGLAVERREHAWMARLSGQIALGREVTVGPGTVKMRLATARLEGCAWPLALLPRVALWPCAGLELGAIAARGGRVAHPGSATDAWAAAHGLGRLRWSLSPRLALEAEGGVSVALTRHAFVFEQPEQVAAHPSLIGAAAAAGAVVTIP